MDLKVLILGSCCTCLLCSSTHSFTPQEKLGKLIYVDYVSMPSKSFAPNCTLCTGDSQSAPSDKMTFQAPVCIDPDCPDSVCDNCPDHEECCQDCTHEGSICEDGDCAADPDCCGGCDGDVCSMLDFTDCAAPCDGFHKDYACGSSCVEEACRIPDFVDCAAPDEQFHKDYVCDGTCFELFGDQAAEMFGVGGLLPQLPFEPKPGFPTWECPNFQQWPNATPRIHDNSDDELRHSAGLLMQAAANSEGKACYDDQRSFVSPGVAMEQGHMDNGCPTSHDGEHAMYTSKSEPPSHRIER